MLYEQRREPLSEADIYNAFRRMFPAIRLENPATIGARLRELAFQQNYRRWYGQLLLRVETGRYFPNPNPPLKLLIADCSRRDPCEKCKSLPGCIRICLRGKGGTRDG